VENNSKRSCVKLGHELLKQKAMEDWSDRLNDDHTRRHGGTNKLRVYRTFKSVFNPEPYLTNRLPIKYRRAMSQIRCGVAPIAVELGRYCNTPYENRKCYECENVENEYHLLMECPMYDDIRNNTYLEALQIIPGFGMYSKDTQFKLFLSDPRLMVITAKTLFSFLNRRKHFVSSETKTLIAPNGAAVR
jgi:hypothetical protein